MFSFCFSFSITNIPHPTSIARRTPRGSHTLTLTARLQPSDGSNLRPSHPIRRPICNPHRQGSTLCRGPESAATCTPRSSLTNQCLTPRCDIADAWLDRGGILKGAQPARPAQPNPTQFVVMENQNPMSMTGHPRNRRAFEKRWERREWRAQKKRERGKTKRRKPPPPRRRPLSTSPPSPQPTLILVQPGPQSAMASSRLSGLSMFPKTLPAPLQTATPAIGPCRPANNDPQTLSSQPAPCLTPPTRCGTAGKGR